MQGPQPDSYRILHVNGSLSDRVDVEVEVEAEAEPGIGRGTGRE